MPRRQPGGPVVLQPIQRPGLGVRSEQSRAEVRQYRQPQMMQTRPVGPATKRPLKTAAERKKDEERKKKKKDLKIAKKR